MFWLTYLLISVVAAPPVAAAAAFVLDPILRHSRSALEKLTLPLIGALASIEGGFARAERTARRLAVRSGRSFIRDENGREPQNWPWKKVVKPLLALLTFSYLGAIDLYLAALAFSALFHSSYVPDLHLSLPLLMGLLWPGLAISWAEALTDVAGADPRPPYASMRPKTRNLLVAVIATGVLTAFVGNILFFLWRQGQLGTVNPYGAFTFPIAGLIGGLLFGGLILSALSGLPFLSILVPLTLAAADLALLAARGAASGARMTMQLGAVAGEAVLDIALELCRQLLRLFTSLVDFVEAALRNTMRGWEQHLERRAARAPSGPGLKHHLGLAAIEHARGFWGFANTFGNGIGSGISSVARAGRDLVVAGGETATTLCEVAGRNMRELLAGTRNLLRDGFAPVLQLLAATALWLFYLVPRVRWCLWNWVCRFDFARQRLHFDPLPDPPPATRLQEQLRRLRLFTRNAPVVSLHGATGPAVAQEVVARRPA